MSLHIYSVSELNRCTGQILERELGEIWLQAELSNIVKPASGHYYFSLKDAHARIRCAFFKPYHHQVAFPLKEGLQVLVKAKTSLYEPRGDYQLIIHTMELTGDGYLQQQFVLLKNKLQQAGWFDPAHKRPPPEFPKTIGIISSGSGAAIRDILQVLLRRYPIAQVIVYPSAVQGDDAENQLIARVQQAGQRRECDVLIISRGGGSLEDLSAFNSESLAQAIYQCPIPIISGIGHEIDFTIADFVADVRAPTPSAAAELATPDSQALLKQLQQNQNAIIGHIKAALHNYQQRLDWYQQRLTFPWQLTAMARQKQQLLTKRLNRAVQQQIQQVSERHRQNQQRLQTHFPKWQIQRANQHLIQQHRRLKKSIQYQLIYYQQKTTSLARTLNSLSPLNALARGYSLTKTIDHDQPLLNTQTLQIGQQITTDLYQGQITSRIEHIKK